MEKKNLKKKFCCFWKNGGEKKIKKISAVFGKTVENFFFLPSHLHHRKIMTEQGVFYLLEQSGHQCKLWSHCVRRQARNNGVQGPNHQMQ